MVSKPLAVDSHSVKWVLRELTPILNDVQRAIADYVEAPEYPDSMPNTSRLLRQIRGTLQILELYGVARLVEEMELVASWLVEDAESDVDQALEALMFASLQLPDYLDRIKAGSPDVPLVLLPVINDLRRIRGQPKLPESIFFSPSQQAIEMIRIDPGQDTNFSHLARRLRPKFMQSLLDWYSDPSSDSALSCLADIFIELEQLSGQHYSAKIWPVCLAVIDSLRDGGINNGAAVKGVFGQIERALRGFIEGGNDEPASSKELLKNLLYLSARSSSNCPTVLAVKRQYGLEELLPKPEQVQQAQRIHAGPNLELLEAASQGVREDILGIKELIEIYVHADNREPAMLSMLDERLQRVLNTLEMLGVAGVSEQLEGKLETIKALQVHQRNPDDALLVDIASSLLRVEYLMDCYVSERINLFHEGMSAATGALKLANLSERESQKIAEALVKESLRLFVYIREMFVEYVAQTDKACGIAQTQYHFDELIGVFKMLSKLAVSKLLSELRAFFVKRYIEADIVPDSYEQELVADAISNLEYYIESLADDNDESSRLHVLDISRSALDQLTTLTQVNPETVDAAVDCLIKPSASTARQPVESYNPVDESVAVGTHASRQIVSRDVDDEILDIFIEEACEEMGEINERLTQWRADPEDDTCISHMRRSFHTLKGSGRLLGAENIGEFAWANEALLNDVLSDHIPISGAIIQQMASSVDMLPQLIAQLRDPSIEINVEPVIARLSAMRHGEQLTSPAQSTKLFEGTMPIDQGIDLPPTDLSRSSIGTPSQVDMGPGQYTPPEYTSHQESVSSSRANEPYARSDVKKTARIAALPDIDTLMAMDSRPNPSPSQQSSIAKSALAEPQSASTSPELSNLEKVTGHTLPLQGSYEGAQLMDDAVLRDIFVRESRTHLKTIFAVIQEAQDVAVGIEPNDQLAHAMHTLLGSSKAAQVSEIAELILPLERALQHKRQHGQLFDGPAVSLMQEIFEQVACVVDQLENSDRIEKDNALKQRVYDFSTDILRDGAQGFSMSQADGELHAVFVDEARELVSDVQKLFKRWQSSPDDLSLVAELMRPLHTIKGSAHMAGYKQIADLVHALESSVTRYNDTLQRVPPTEEYFDLLQEAIDALFVNIEQASSNQFIGEFKWIIKDLASDLQRAKRVEGQSQADTGWVDSTKSAPSARRWATQPPLPDEHNPSQDSTAKLGDLIRSVVAEEPAPKRAQSTQNNVIPLPTSTHMGVVEEALNEKIVIASMPLGDEEGKDQRQVRVRAELLDNLVNNVGEISIYHSQQGQKVSEFGNNLGELNQTIERLASQLRQMDKETEAHILHGYDSSEANAQQRDFDPLELDRYSRIQELSRALLESVSDLHSIKNSLNGINRDSETLFQQQTRTNSEIQSDILRTRMVRFDDLEARFARVVRQTAHSLDKKVALVISGGQYEIDRSIKERIAAPLEHILRNAVVHGIEKTNQRIAMGKSPEGRVIIRLSIEGGNIHLRIVDDGGGINMAKVRQRGVEKGLISPTEQVDSRRLMQLLLESGFSTCEEVTQIAGRGVGLDIVKREIKQIGGTLSLETQTSVGCLFAIYLPQTIAIGQSILVSCDGDTYALPANSIRGVNRISTREIEQYYADPNKRYEYAGEHYRIAHLSNFLQQEKTVSINQELTQLVMLRSGSEKLAVQVDELVGRHEIVMKNVGDQLSSVKSIAGAAVLGDGRVVLILDVAHILQSVDQLANVALDGKASRRDAAAPLSAMLKDTLTVMMVDDSITMRKVTSRALERHHINVLTAKDGVDAVTQLRETVPDLILLDIEMPRMDGFELAKFIRGDKILQSIPIIMITSRTGEKHRRRALDIGVNHYIGKPYQELELMKLVSKVLNIDIKSRS